MNDKADFRISAMVANEKKVDSSLKSHRNQWLIFRGVRNTAVRRNGMINDAANQSISRAAPTTAALLGFAQLGEESPIEEEFGKKNGEKLGKKILYTKQLINHRIIEADAIDLGIGTVPRKQHR
ncbi:unnamed protein product [Strongylus vulgaris]|uniref:Uncharacterized protein n=1 Tax=Strongylus vulgaris TaxID=40348 RepID=A0A3P7IXG0_STRVU|nr:unnamed protein product [Strongylus vulgaris]